MNITVRLERNDDIPAFGAFLRCEGQHEDPAVILLNVEALMAPELMYEDGSAAPQSREDRKRNIIHTMMHEFGHVLESFFRLPVNEEAIEGACEEWEAAYDAMKKGNEQ